MDFIRQLQIQRSDYKYASQARTQSESLKQLSAGIYTEEERFVYELLQNAVDAFIETQNRCLNIVISIKEDILCFKHNGSPFSQKDIEGLCDVGQSNKAENTNSTNKKKVGYKGIGFKSVFMQSVDYVCVKSGSYCFKFDKTECAKLMPSFPDGKLDPDDTPWQIVPITCSAPNNFSTARYNVATFIKSNSIQNLSSKIKKLLENPQFLLFLNADNINIKFFKNSTQIISAGRETSDGGVRLTCNNEVVSRWLVHTTRPIPVDKTVRESLKNDFNTPPKLKEATDFEISFAISVSQNGDIQEVEDSVLYTFLPTSYKNLGVPFLINANFITDAGRQQLHQQSEWNRLIFASIPKHFFKWVAELSLKHHDFYKILPSKNPKSSDELTRIYADSFQSALDAIAFIPSRKENGLLRVKEAINDNVDFASVVGINTLIKHINKEYSKSFTRSSFFDCEDSKTLDDYGVFCFDVNKLKAYFDDKDAIGALTAQQCKEFIDFFVRYTDDSNSKDRIINTIKDCRFLLCDDNKVRIPSDCYFPTEYSSDKSNIPLIHPKVFQYIKAKRLFDWFKELGVENMSLSNYLNDVYCKCNYNITKDNAIEVGKIVYEAFLKGSLDSIPTKYLKRLKFLSTTGELFYADELYLSQIYHPQYELEDMVDDDMFVSEKYAEYGDINIWKSIFLHLGMSENLNLTKRRYYEKIKNICTVQDSHASELAIIEKDFNKLPTYHYMYAYEIEYYPAVINISENEILAKLFTEIFKSTYKKIDDSCFLYYRWGVGEHLSMRGDFLKKKNADFNIRVFILKHCQLYPTTTGTAMYANEIFLNTEINSLICGRYLPVLGVKTTLSESWASILPFKRDLQIEDLLTLLTKAADDSENDNKDRICSIYKRIVELGLQNSPSINEWGKNNRILTKRDGEFLSPSELYHITIDGFKSDKRAYTGKIDDSIKDSLLELFRNMGVRVIDKVNPVFKGERESNELRELLLKKSQYIALLKKENEKKKSFSECHSLIDKKINESTFIHCKSISLSYGDEDDVIDKNTFSQDNAFYYTGSLKASRLEPLLDPLCKYFGIRGYSSELLIVLITSEHDELVEFLKEKGYDTSNLVAPVNQRVNSNSNSTPPRDISKRVEIEIPTEEKLEQLEDNADQEVFGEQSDEMPRELFEKNIADINAMMEGTGFTLSPDDRNAEHIITRFRILEFIKAQGFKLASDFNEEEYLRLEKYSAIPLANGLYVNVQGAKYGIWNVSPEIWEDIVERGNYMCLCIGNGPDDFIFINGEDDIKDIAEKTKNVFIRLTATERMDIMSTIKSIFSQTASTWDNICIKEIYPDRDAHLMLLVHKTKDKVINSMYYTDFSSDGGGYGF